MAATVGSVRGGGGVNATGFFLKRHPLDAMEKASTTELSRQLRMSGHGREFEMESRSAAIFAREIDSTIMQLNGPVRHC